MNTRLSVAIASVALLAACAGPNEPSPGSRAPGAPPSNPAPAPVAVSLSLTRVLDGLTRPLGIYHAGDGSERLFVLEQGGRIRIVSGGKLTGTPFLDIAAKVTTTGNEQGLLGMAFHPNYRENGIFFVHYSGESGKTVLSRYRVKSGNPDEADASSEQVLFTTPQPFANHNGGTILFGPDGYLYIALGDGGSSGDPRNNAQNPESFLGKILRIDVTSTSGYTSPKDNPFVGKAGLDEIWAYGLRNPWRISFDRTTGDLWIADVGQNKWEEINIQPGGSHGGENYGWRVFEGLERYSSGNLQGVVNPVAVYGRELGCSITGGNVYRGQAIAGLAGAYLYADFCSGRIWGLTRQGGSWVSSELLKGSLQVTAFGEDEAGELYLVHRGGTLYRITAK